MTSLTEFTVTAHYLTVVAPDGDSTGNGPLFAYTDADVTFFPRVSAGFEARVTDLAIEDGSGSTTADTAVSLAPIQAKLLDGQLVSIDSANTPGVKLIACDDSIEAALLSTNLFYDVRFDPQTRGDTVPTNFAFKAPTDASDVCLTDPDLDRQPYAGPEL